MFLNYKPTWKLSAVVQITPADLKRHGIKAVLADLDNTLIAWDNPTGTKELQAWIKTMAEAKIPVVVVSNNNAKRIHRAVTSLGLPYIARAMKPFSFGIRRAKVQLGLADSEIVMVGDQLLTDMLAANAAHIRTILVHPLVETDAWNTSITRFFEKFFMRHLDREYPELTWRNSLND
ncbi:YqeG family HAD IIIA-type phosphatase [Loigolactobacillus backii]|uniref:HAD family hydrolase n=1 Tax=Loigolactobacillus backii TaxID=375175 RepID=A0A192H1N3_9LACO|nr:YqeG family HAD IIIA-type phosphatase [Loigolactobacillus backii]ANK59306.1 HAD family hydrolase [Loigolactobacillus backii]ANK62719.1 HAD family hydrolase [Loigolactobacillus backii]ANK64298.1 HAD family hydrolase [Loigolactobacillus backii]ANK67308.1 HAD family hydrolase [Loigolactobacillus backii]ANK70273.1 HAD family hydrolase [Loigolactobacillus backii]